MAPIFSGPRLVSTHEPVNPGTRRAVTTKTVTDVDHHAFEVAHVAMHVAAIRPQVEDGIANELTRPVIRHVTAAAGLDDVDTEPTQRLGCGEDVLAGICALHPDGDDGWMLQQQQQVVRPPGFAILDEGTLQIERLAVAHDSKAADEQRAVLIHALYGGGVEVLQLSLHD